MDKGYLYVSNHIKYTKEAEVSARSLKDKTSLPIVLITSLMDYQSDLFKEIIYLRDIEKYSYASKIIGLIHSPFKQTIFLDTDTFVCDNIDHLFEMLNRFDIAAAYENSRHSILDRKYIVKYVNCFPEFNTGVILLDNIKCKSFLNQWLNIFENYFREYSHYIDQASFRDAIIESNVKISTLPPEYNFRGIFTGVIAYGKIFVIHDRLKVSFWNRRPIMEDYNKMSKYVNKINKIGYKRLVIKGFGVIPYRYSPYNILNKVKKILGIKMLRKKDSY